MRRSLAAALLSLLPLVLAACSDDGAGAPPTVATSGIPATAPAPANPGAHVVVAIASSGDPASVVAGIVDYLEAAEGMGASGEVIENDRARLFMPGVTDAAEARELLRPTPVSFRPVLAVGQAPGSSPALESGEAVPPGVDPATGLSVADDADAESWLLEPSSGLIYHVGPAVVGGADFAGAEASLRDGSFWVVDPSFTPDGAVRFREATGELAQYPIHDPRRRFAIVVRGEVVSAPVLAEGIGPEGLDPNAVTISLATGALAEDAEQLAAAMTAGSILDAVDVLSVSIVGP